MPTKRRPIERGRVVELSPYQAAVLLDVELPEPDDDDTWWSIVEAGGSDPNSAYHGRSLKVLWAAHRDVILTRHARERPGTRPACWWTFDAPRQPAGRYAGWWYDGKLPEPRRRLGGRGVPLWERLAQVPSYDYGLPSTWVNGWYVEQFGLRAEDAFDPSDPPVYEAQAVYLERFNLLLPGERRRLKPRDFEPEAVTLDDVDHVVEGRARLAPAP